MIQAADQDAALQSVEAWVKMTHQSPLDYCLKKERCWETPINALGVSLKSYGGAICMICGGVVGLGVAQLLRLELALILLHAR